MSTQASDPAGVVITNPEVIGPVTPGVFTGDVRNLPRAPQWVPGDPTFEVPRQQFPPAAGARSPVPGQRDPLLDRQASLPASARDRVFTTPMVNMDGQPFNAGFPPDTTGDVGPNHFLQAINAAGGSSVRFYDKTGATLATILMSSLATGGDACATGRGDPQVLYDPLADRWYMLEFANGANRLCTYVSMTGDPVTGGWRFYGFDTPSFPDYPKVGVWPTGYFIGTNEGTPALYAQDRAAMLTGAAATMQRLTAPGLAGFGFQVLVPSDIDGSTATPANEPNHFVRHRDDEVHNAPGTAGTDFIDIFDFTVDFATPANSMVVAQPSVAISEIDSDLCGLVSFFCFPQPGTANTLDPLREVMMHRIAYRNFGTHQTIVGNLTTDVTGADQGGIRWVELRKVGAGAWTLFQEGTHAPDATNRWMGSIAMDQAGNIALGYSVSDATSVFPGIRYAGRLATDPAGTLPQGETTLIAGAAAQTASTRWGDYSMMVVDPADDCTFWYTNEYIPSGTGNLWTTRIGSFKFDSCGAAPPPPTFTYNAAGAGTGTGTMSAGAGSGISCTSTAGALSGDCVEAGIAAGTMFNVTATPAAGSSFVSWANCTSTSGPSNEVCNITLNSNLTTTATFTAATPPTTFTYNAAGAGTGTGTMSAGAGSGINCMSTAGVLSGDCSEPNIAAGTMFSVTATPAAGSTFAGWASCTSTSGTSNEVCNVTLNADLTTTATFNTAGGLPPPGPPAPPVPGQGVQQIGAAPLNLNASGRSATIVYGGMTGGGTVFSESGVFPVNAVLTAATNHGWDPGWTIRPGDFNGDGRTDLFFYNFNTGAAFKAISDGTFNFSYTALAYSPGWSIAILNLNGDALADAFFYNAVTGQYFRGTSTGDGTGDFSFVGGVWSAAWLVIPMRLDADALDDVFVYNKTSGDYYWTINDGANDFTCGGISCLDPNVPPAPKFSPNWELTAGHFNADALGDLFFYNSTTGESYVGLNTGAGGFTFTGATLAAGWTVLAGDFSGDGIDDLYLYNFTTGAYIVKVANGTGGFTDTAGMVSAGWQTFVSSFNLDALADLLFYNATTGSYFQGITTTPGSFNFFGGNFGAGQTIVTNQP